MDKKVKKEMDDDKTPKPQSNQTPQQEQVLFSFSYSARYSLKNPTLVLCVCSSSRMREGSSSLVPFQESPSLLPLEDYPHLTGLIQSKSELRNSHLKAPKANLSITTTTPNQSRQINKTWPMDQRPQHLQLKESYLSKATITHGSSSPSVNVATKPDLPSLSQEPDSASFGLQTRRTLHKNWSLTDDMEISQGSVLPRIGNRLSIFKKLAMGIKIPDMSSSSGKGNMSANSPTPKASAEPFTLNPPRQAAQKLSSGLWDSSTYPLNFPILSSERQSRKELKNAHLKTPTANLSNTTTTTTHGSSPSVDLPETVTQEPDLSSPSEDKLKDDEITGQDQGHSALDDNVQ